MNPVVAFVADAGPVVGAGHVMRALTLAAAVATSGATPVLVSRQLPESLRRRAESLGIATVDRRHRLTEPGVVAETLGTGCRLIVVDSYEPSLEVMTELTARLPVLVIDDERSLPLARPAAVLNQNLHAAERDYLDLPPDTRLLMGPRWALIRREVVEQHPPPPRVPDTALIALGGSDVRGLTEALRGALLERGAAPVAATGLVRGPRSESGDPRLFAEALATCEIALVGAGTTVWECLHLGTPAIALITAANQATIGRSAVEAGVVDAVFDVRERAEVEEIAAEGHRLLADAGRRRELSLAGPRVVDGQGAERVAAVALELLS